MKVLYILSTFYRGGAELSTLRLAFEMQKMGHEVSAIGMQSGGELIHDFRQFEIPTYAKPTARAFVKELLPGTILDLVYRLRVVANRRRYMLPYVPQRPLSLDRGTERFVTKVVRSLVPDIVHVNQTYCVDALRWARDCGVQGVIYTHHDMTSHVLHPIEIERLNALVGCSDWVTFVSSAQRDDFLRCVQYPVSRTAVVYPKTMFEGKAKEYKAMPVPLVLGTMSNLSPVKNPIMLLKAVEFLRGKGENVKLIIAGGDPRWKAVVREQVGIRKMQNQVQFLGVLRTDRDLNDFYSSIDVYVSTSLSESFGRTTCEAMSCGVPIIASEVGPAREIIEEGKNGYLYLPEDLTELISKITYFIRNPHKLKDMGISARNRYLEHFEVQPFSSVYEQLCKKSLLSQV